MKIYVFFTILFLSKNKILNKRDMCGFFQSNNKKNVPGVIVLSDFKNFSEINFNCLHTSFPKQIYFKPSSFCSLDKNLRIENFGQIKKFYLDLNFFYLSSINLNINIYQDLFEFNQVYFKIFHSKLLISFDNEDNCNPEMLRKLNIKTLYTIQFAYSVVYIRLFCISIHVHFYFQILKYQLLSFMG